MEDEADPNRLKELLLKCFREDLKDRQLSYNELLFFLDERAHNLECDRTVARELFLQSSPLNTTTTLQRFVERYIDNLSTCKLCKEREEISLAGLQGKLTAAEQQRNQTTATPYAFITVEKAVMHAHYGPAPVFAYKIEPSSLPPVTFINETNISINDSYTLELPDRYFELVFLESGIEMIERYRFSAVGKRSGEEYFETFNQKGLEVSLRVKYYDKLQEMDRNIEALREDLRRKQLQLENAKSAYQRLLEFEPFVTHYRKARRAEHESERGCMYGCSEWLLKVLPCLRHHVRNYYYWAFLLLMVQAASSLYCPLVFINVQQRLQQMILPFYILGAIYVGLQHVQGRLWLLVLLQLLIIGNDIVALVLHLGSKEVRLRWLLWIETGCEAISLLLLWIIAMRSHEFDQQSDELLTKEAA